MSETDDEEGRPTEKVGPKKTFSWKAFLRTPFGIGVTAFVVGAVLGVVGMLYFQNSQTIAKPQAPDVSVVYERIISQNELVTASERYNITDKATDANEFFNLFEIPFTENSFWYRYVGTIKVGVNLDDATFSQEGDTITVSLPSPYISSDTPDMDESGVLEENDNILNPVHAEDVVAFQAKCQEEGESEVAEGGIFDEARTNAEKDITNMFVAAFGDKYSIQFDWQQ